jgi:hypothetical protein
VVSPPYTVVKQWRRRFAVCSNSCCSWSHAMPSANPRLPTASQTTCSRYLPVSGCFDHQKHPTRAVEARAAMLRGLFALTYGAQAGSPSRVPLNVYRLDSRGGSKAFVLNVYIHFVFAGLRACWCAMPLQSTRKALARAAAVAGRLNVERYRKVHITG